MLPLTITVKISMKVSNSIVNNQFCFSPHVYVFGQEIEDKTCMQCMLPAKLLWCFKIALEYNQKVKSFLGESTVSFADL